MMKLHIHRRATLGPRSDSLGKTIAAATTTAKAAIARSASKKREPPAPPNCSICQEPVGLPNPEGVTETWAALPCGHRFGSSCIKTWLSTAGQPNCPICRLPMKHRCKHPVLPVVVPEMPCGGDFKKPPSRASTFGSAAGPGTPGSQSGGSWRGRELSSSCGFCAVQRRKLVWRCAVAIVRVVLWPRRRRRVATTTTGADVVPALLIDDDDDPWESAFQVWYTQQEPRAASAPVLELR